jgi:2-dehydro-3-deoxyphosphogluconate aldolase/(4S)-4-hydroxy-2-oxoglutarate aldolase
MTLELTSIADVGIIAVLRAPSADAAVSAVDALVAGGVTGVEITFSTPDAETAIAEVARRHGDAVLLGAGTVTRPEQAESAVAAGARFLVCPGTEATLARAMKDTGAAVMLGAMTPTEVMAATALGADVVKVFPASLGGPSYLRSLRGPFPDVPLMPTGGVNADNLGQWFGAGALAVGAGSELCSPAAMKAGNWEVVEDSARSFSAALAATRAAA